jgi:hypothetical protein
MGAVIIGWTVVAIIVGVIAQRGLGRTGLAWGLATLALEITLASFVKGQPPAGMPEWAYDIGGFICNRRRSSRAGNGRTLHNAQAATADLNHLRPGAAGSRLLVALFSRRRLVSAGHDLGPDGVHPANDRLEPIELVHALNAVPSRVTVKLGKADAVRTRQIPEGVPVKQEVRRDAGLGLIGGPLAQRAVLPGLDRHRDNMRRHLAPRFLPSQGDD